MSLSTKRVHRELQVEDGGRVLTNREKSGQRWGQFSEFFGTCSSPIPLRPSPSALTTPRYWETHSRLQWNQGLGGPLLEMGVCESSSLDKSYFVSDLPGSWSCVSVWDSCHRHPGDHLCIQVLRERSQVGDCITVSPLTPGTVINISLGLVLDVGRGKLLHKFDARFQEEVYPVFYVEPLLHYCDVITRLVSGRDISVTDTKLALIQEARRGD